MTEVQWLCETSQLLQDFTSCAVVYKRFIEIKGGRGPVLHWEELADPAGRRGLDSTHLAVQDRLEVAALTPQQGRNVSEEKDELCITSQS